MLDFLQSDDGITLIASSVVTFATILLTHLLQGRVKLIAFSPNSSFFQIDLPEGGGDPVLINSGQVIIQNQGRIAAEEVEIISGRGPAPAGYNIVPHVGHQVEYDNEGRWKVRFPFIAPKEAVTIQILNGAPIENIRCKDALARVVPVMYQRIYPAWLNYTATTLIFIGIFALAYWVIGFAV